MPIVKNFNTDLILEKYPSLGALLTETKDLTVSEYIDGLYQNDLGSNQTVSLMGQKVLDRFFGKKASKEVQSLSFLQTAPHLGFSLSDRMSTIAWMTSLGLKKEDTLFIGACASVPFSNSSWPARISFNGQVFNLAKSARYQDSLVSLASGDFIEIKSNLPTEVKKIISDNYNDDLKIWMCNVLSYLLAKFLNRKVIVFSADDLARSLLLGDYDTFLEVVSTAGVERYKPIWLYLIEKKGFFKFDNLQFSGNQGNNLEWKGNGVEVTSVEEAWDNLVNNKSWPSAWLMYSTFAKVLDWRLAGSFIYAGYYPFYLQKWESLGWKLDRSKKLVVTTGTHPKLKNQSLWDIVLSGKTSNDIDSNLLFWEMLMSII